MKVITTNDTSFKGHFISNAKTGVRVFKQEKNVWLKIVMVLGFVVAPFFWFSVALSRSRNGDKVMKVVA